MASFQNKFDLIIKDFCKEIASVYSLDENELFSLWNKGTNDVNSVRLFNFVDNIGEKRDTVRIFSGSFANFIDII